MKKSLFLKQFLVYMSILLVSFVILGVVLTYAFKEYYLKQKEQLLTGQAERISEQYAQGIYTGIIDNKKINTELSVLSNNLGASTILVSRNGRVLFASADVDREWVGAFVDTEAIANVLLNKSIVTDSRFGGIFSDSALTVIYPISVENQVFAALVMNVSVPGVREQIIGVYETIFLVLALCGIIAFIALYFSVKKITKPLIEINQAAKVIAGGDFEKRIETDLKDEVGQLAQSFNEMAESLSRLEENKRLLITNISHDIRSPLTSIQGFVTAMLDGTVEAESFPKYLRIVRDESQRIVKLANEMLEGALKTEMTAFDINALIKKISEKAEQALAEKQLGLELIFAEEETLVYADYDKIERVLDNILENAIKFTDDGKITFEIEVNSKIATVFISDTGIGLTEEEQRQVFQRFYKADNSRGQYKTGNGLGLSIVKDIIKAHDQTVNISSAKGVGTTLSFTLQIYIPKKLL